MNMIKNKYNMIVAADSDWCIGKNGKLLTSISQDMKFFKFMTTNKVVIMGKNTQLSLPNKTYLKNRINIVLDNSPTNIYPSDIYNPDGIVTYHSDIDYIPKFIDLSNRNITINKVINNITLTPEMYDINFIHDNDVFVIGGGQIYTEFLKRDMINTIFLTKIYQSFKGDTFIPNLYQLGFKDYDVMIPRTKNADGIEFEILMLKK